MKPHPWELAWKDGRWYESSPAFPAVVKFGEYLKQARAKTVLDFGAGAGRHSIYLGAEGFEVVAFDISSSALNLLHRRAKSGRLDSVYAVQADMSSLPFRDESFDAVVGNNVLHHVTTDRLALAVKEVERVMRSGAIAYFSVLSKNDYKHGRGRFLEPGTYVSTESDELGIIHHFFSEDELKSCFAEFEIISLNEELIPIEKGQRGHYHLRFRKK